MAGTNRYSLLATALSGNGVAQTINKSGTFLFFAEATTWTASSVKVQFLSPQNTWIDYPGASLTANSGVVLQMPPGQYRGVGVGAALSAAFADLVTLPTETTR